MASLEGRRLLSVVAIRLGKVETILQCCYRILCCIQMRQSSETYEKTEIVLDFERDFNWSPNIVKLLERPVNPE
jgi:hypothetical protein